MRNAPGQLFLVGDDRVACRVCGRLLRSKTSKQRGYGTGCWRRRKERGHEEAVGDPTHSTTQEQAT
jgi:hypothetical protein